MNLPVASPQRVLLEQAGSISTQQYLIARLKTEALIEYDFDAGNAKDLLSQTEDTLESWRMAQLAADLTVELADAYGASADFEDSSPATMTDSASPSSAGIWGEPVAHAEESDAALKWAEDLTARFDSYPAGKQVRALAEELGTDAKNAFAQLQMAQDIIKGDAYKTEGDWAAAVEKALVATQTTCKVGLYVGSVVATGGVANGVLQAGGLVVSGVDTMVDVAKTGTTIFLGKNNKITIAADEMKNTLAPVVSAAGAINVFSGTSIASGLKAGADFSKQMSSLSKMTFIGDSVLNLAQSDNITGVAVAEEKDGATVVEAKTVDLRDKDDKQVREALKQAGIPEPDEADKTGAEGPTIGQWSAQRASQMEVEGPLTEAELKKIFEDLQKGLAEASGETPEESAPAPAPQPQAPEPSGTINQLVGSYEGQQGSPDGTSEPMYLTFTTGGPNELVDQDGDVWSFDPATNTASIYLYRDGLEGTFEITFTIDGTAVYYNGTLSLQGPDGPVYLPLSGTKVG